MELSDPDATSGAGDNITTPANRRKSGRTIRKPDLFEEHQFAGSVRGTSSAKRKRAPGDLDLEGDEEEPPSDEDAGESSEGSADEEEIKEKRKAPRQKRSTSKKQKLANGTGPKLAIRPPPNRQKAQKKSKPKVPRVRKSQAGDPNAIYAKLFAQGQNADAIAAEWLQVYKENNVQAVCDAVNFVLRCTGGDLTVDVHDIEDVDNVTSRLGDLQDEYQAQKPAADYPLVSRTKQYVGFRDGLTGFFTTLVATLHSSNTLYSDSALIENIQTWVSTMSSAPIRPFRHTATVISLAIMNALCDVAVELQTLQSNSEQQVEKEKKNKRVNKDRVTSMTKKVQEYKEKLETIDNVLKDSFDTVFVHRYRDVEPRIRAECVTGLGYWISTYQSMFFEGQYLRYLGWVLSDTVSNTRAEVVKQLRTLFGSRNSVPRLRAFTDRFRPRMVEMAAKDADPAVRTITVELLDSIREHGLLEPDDIDTIGQLIFDSEVRVRKAVARFFVANITDVYDTGLEDALNGEKIKEYLPNDDSEDFMSPKSAWIRFKCLADVLQQYDSGDDGQERPANIERGPPGSRDAVIAAGIESRFTLAAQAIYPHMKELQHWEWLAGQLLFDHSTISEPTTQDDTAAQLKAMYKLDEGHEIILLEVLASAVRLRLLQIAELEKDGKGKKKSRGASVNTQKASNPETPESVARSLTSLIPQLLNKFSAVPAATSAVLRLEHFLNLDILEDLQQSHASYSSLLDKISEQFLGHSDDNVLAQATATLSRAKAHEEMDEMTEDKFGELWTDTISSLRALTSGLKDVESASDLLSDTLEELVSTVSRIASLAGISDPSEEFSKVPGPQKSSKQRTATPNLSPLTIIQQFASRASKRGEVTDDQVALLEDSLAISSFKALAFHFMWTNRAVEIALSTRTDVSPADAPISFLADLTKTFVPILAATLNSRSGVDPVRLVAGTILLEVHTLLGTLRGVKPAKNATDVDVNSILALLVQPVSPEHQALLIALFVAVEKHYAKKAHRSLEVADDDPPEDEELGEPEDEDEEADEDEAAVLLAEQSLCELTGKIVLAIVASVLDSSGPSKGKLKERLLRNKAKLGANYKDILGYLDDPRINRKPKPKAKEVMKSKSQPLVLEDDIEDDEAIEGQREEEDGEEDGGRGELVEDGNQDRGNDDGEEVVQPEDDEIMGD